MSCPVEAFRYQNISLSVFLVSLLVSSCVRLAWIPSPGDKLWKTALDENNAIRRLRYVYLFNWTNPYNVFSKNETPNVEEVGPFVFTEMQNISEIQWTNEDRVSYKRQRYWTIDKKLSADCEANINHVNIVFAKYMEVFRNESSATLQRAYDFLIKDHNEQFIVTKTARELIFDGYYYSLFEGTRFQLAVNQRYFGWFLGLNGSIDSLTESSNGFRTLNATFGFNLHTNNVLNYEGIFNRSIQLYRSDEKASLGVKYIGFDKSLTHCMSDNDECFSALSPLSMSLPHFFDRVNPPKVNGINPNSEQHQPIAIYDERSEYDLESNLTYQLNIKLNPINWSETILRNITKIEMPMMWFKDYTDSSAITAKSAELFSRMNTIKNVLNVLIVFFSLGLVTPLALIFLKVIKFNYRLLS